jgi:hypothetical protein
MVADQSWLVLHSLDLERNFLGNLGGNWLLNSCCSGEAAGLKVLLGLVLRVIELLGVYLFRLTEAFVVFHLIGLLGKSIEISIARWNKCCNTFGGNVVVS